MTVKKLITGILLVLTFFPAPQFVQALSIPTSTDAATTTTAMPTATLSTSPSTNTTTPALAVPVDTTAPIVGAITPKVAVVGTAVTLSSTVSDDVGVTTCTLLLTDSAKVVTKSAMTLTTAASGTTAAASTTFKTAGKYGAAALCNDLAGNSTRGTTVVLTVSTSSTATPVADTTAPKIGVVSPLVATAGTAVTLTSTVSDDVSLSSCFIILRDSTQTSTKTAMTLATNVAGVSSATLSKTFQTAETLAAVVSCADTSGNRGNSIVGNIVVSAATSTTNPLNAHTGSTTVTPSLVPSISTGLSSSLDTTAPVVGIISPLIATVGVTQKFSTTATDSSKIASCTMSLTNSAGTVAVPMTLGDTMNGVTPVTVSYAFKNAGSFVAVAMCKDASGNEGKGKDVTVVVSSATTQTNTQAPGGTAPSSSNFTVGSISPTTAIAGTQAKLSAPITGISSITGIQCTLGISVGTQGGSMTTSDMSVVTSATGGTALAPYTFTSAGTYTGIAICFDANANKALGTSTVITVSASSTQAPGGTAPTANTTTQTPTTTTSTTVPGGTAPTTDTTTQTTAPGGTVPTTTTTQTTPTAVQPTTQAATPVFAVGPVLPTTAIVGTSASITAPILNASSLIGMKCSFLLTNSAKATSIFSMTPSTTSAGDMASLTFTFKSAETYSAFAACTDALGAKASGKPVAIIVSSSSTGTTTQPATGTNTSTNTNTQPATGTTATTQPAAGTASQPATGTTTQPTGTTSNTPTQTQPATTTTDTNAGNTEQPAATTPEQVPATTQAPTSSDVTTPTIGSLSPVQFTTGIASVFSASISDDSGETGLSCVIVLSLGRTQIAKIPTVIASGIATATFKFLKSGSYVASVLCADVAQNRTTGPLTTITVTDPAVAQTQTSTATAGTATTTTNTSSAQTGASTTPAGTTTTTTADGSTVTTNSSTGTTTTTTSAGTTTTTTSASVSTADVTPPTVGKVLPRNAAIGIPVMIGAVVSDAVGVTSCTYSLDDIDHGQMKIENGQAMAKYAFVNAGDHTILIYCADAAGNVGKSKLMYVRVAAQPDTTAPLVGTIPAVQATVNVPVSATATYVDNIGVTSCNIYLDAVDSGAMALSNGTATASVTVTTDGSHSLYVGCVDAAGNVGASESATTFDVAKVSGDLMVPVIGAVSPTSTTQNLATIFSVSATDDSGVKSCNLFVDNADQGEMTVVAGSSTFSRSYTFAKDGTFSVYADCVDAVGNDGVGASTGVVVSAAVVTATDSVAPTVGAITPSSTITGTPTTLSASVADSVGVLSCELYVDSVDAGAMTVANGMASFLYTFTVAGSAAANAYCRDAAGNATRGDSTLITITDAATVVNTPAETVTYSSAVATPGSLMKLACYANSDVNDPCKAVYFYSKFDGKRHVFTNANAFFTWYTDFDAITIVSDSFMASISIGKNVVYRPGVKLVKFDSSPVVYAVTKGGVLRAIPSEALAAALYGADWSKKVDAVSDAFHANYTFGESLSSSADYNANTEQSSVSTIDVNLE